MGQITCSIRFLAEAEMTGLGGNLKSTRTMLQEEPKPYVRAGNNA